MMNMKHTTRHEGEKGMAAGVVVALVAMALAVIIFAGLAVWSFMQYNEQKTNVDGKISQAVAEAERDQAAKDEEKFIEREKQPNLEFIGPSDYGSLSFKYPKTWSVYVASDAADGGDYEAYLSPRLVPPVDDENRFALRVTIREEAYSDVLGEYESAVSEGDLKTSVVKFGTETGTRLDGQIDENTRGSIVLLKIRDKTAVLQTDANTFKSDFDKIVKSVTYNQ